MSRLLFKLVKLIARRLPVHWLEAMLLSAINEKADTLPPDDGLRFLFRLDNRLYEGQSRLAIRLENGQHPKLRLTSYHDFFVELVGPGERVLDVGCGKGALAHDLARRCLARVVAVDLSEENIDKAKSRFADANLTFLAGDALTALPAGNFDTVVLSNVLEHLPNRPDFLARLMTVTQAKRLLLRVPAIDRDWRVPLKRELNVEWRADPTHYTEYTMTELEDELTQASLCIDKSLVRWGEIWAVARPT